MQETHFGETIKKEEKKGFVERTALALPTPTEPAIAQAPTLSNTLAHHPFLLCESNERIKI